MRERLREAMKSLNCGHLILGLHAGSTPTELVRQSTEIFARKVMPHLRDMWSEWEDKWSPHTAAGERTRAPGVRTIFCLSPMRQHRCSRHDQDPRARLALATGRSSQSRANPWTVVAEHKKYSHIMTGRVRLSY